MSPSENRAALQARLKAAERHVRLPFAAECGERALARCTARYGQPPQVLIFSRAFDAMRAHSPESSELIEVFRALMAYASNHGGAHGTLASSMALVLLDGSDVWEVARAALSLCVTSDEVDAEVLWMLARLDALTQTRTRPDVADEDFVGGTSGMRRSLAMRYGAPPAVFEGDDGAIEATRARSSRCDWA
jgi:hypothetical protein